MKNLKIPSLLLILMLTSVFFSGCATTADRKAADQHAGYDDEFTLDDDWDSSQAMVAVEDPYEDINRFMFSMNGKLYKYVLTPASKVYDFLIPKKVQSSINNFAQLIGTPKRFFNNLFQGKPKAAATEIGRLLINSTIGIGGLFDPADRVFKLEQQNEDFGQTLGHYGMEAGTYMVWPLIGPSTTREAIGFVFDAALSPLLWLGIYDVSPEDGFQAISLTKRVNTYSYVTKDAYERLTGSAVDPYIALQYAFIENREKKIKE